MHIDQPLTPNNPITNYGNWLHEHWPWQLHATVRLPRQGTEKEFRHLVQSGLVRPLSKFAGTVLLGVGVFAKKPRNHAHLLLYSRKVDLRPLCTHTEDKKLSIEGTELLHIAANQRRDALAFEWPALMIEPYRDVGGAKYFARNFYESAASPDVWVFGKKLLSQDKGRPARPLRDLFFGLPAGTAAA